MAQIKLSDKKKKITWQNYDVSMLNILIFQKTNAL